MGHRRAAWFAGGGRVEVAQPATFGTSTLAPGLMQDDQGVYASGTSVIRV